MTTVTVTLDSILGGAPPRDRKIGRAILERFCDILEIWVYRETEDGDGPAVTIRPARDGEMDDYLCEEEEHVCVCEAVREACQRLWSDAVTVAWTRTWQDIDDAIENLRIDMEQKALDMLETDFKVDPGDTAEIFKLSRYW